MLACIPLVNASRPGGRLLEEAMDKIIKDGSKSQVARPLYPWSTP
jgi:hypothetical protein